MARAIISDIHANIEALEAVLLDIDEQNKIRSGDNKIDTIDCLGDIVDYGANPKEAIELTRKSCRVIIAGNHDLDAIGKFEMFTGFSYEWIEMRHETEWTRSTLFNEEPHGLISRAIQIFRVLADIPEPSLKEALNDNEYFKFFDSLPLSYREEGILYVHGVPVRGLSTLRYFGSEFTLASKDTVLGPSLEKILHNISGLCFVGHSHGPSVGFYEADLPRIAAVKGNYIVERKMLGSKAIINVGSVGQPRDKDPRACYVIYDREKIEYRRVLYDAAKAAKKIMACRINYQTKLANSCRLMEGT